MLTDSRFVDREFPILIQREVLGRCPEKRHDFSYAAMRKGRKRGKFPILFPVNGRHADRFVLTASATKSRRDLIINTISST
jgi:hypothetical protein